MLKRLVALCALTVVFAAWGQEDHTAGIQEQARGMARLGGLGRTCGWMNPYQVAAMEGVAREIVAQSAVRGQEARAKVEAARASGESAGKLKALCGEEQDKQAAQALGRQMGYMMALRVQALMEAQKKVAYGPGLLDTTLSAGALSFLFDEAKTRLGRDYVAVKEVQDRDAPKILASVCFLRVMDRAPAPRVCPAVSRDDAERTPVLLAELDSAEAFLRAYVAARAE